VLGALGYGAAGAGAGAGAKGSRLAHRLM
jgi:hypothetical protein